MKRMLDDYQHKFYNKLVIRSRLVRKDDFNLAREIHEWKSKIRAGWQHLEVIRIGVPDPARRALGRGAEACARHRLVGPLPPGA